MFGRTARIALVLLATQLTGCFCCCERPFFWRKYYGMPGGGCCEPCTTCCGSPMTPAYGPAVGHGAPVMMGAPVTMPTIPAAPAGNPQADRMQPISSTALNGIR